MADNLDNIINRIKNNSKEENKQLVQEMKRNLSEEQTQSLNKLMSDKELVKKLFASEQVQQIIKKLGGDNNGYK